MARKLFESDDMKFIGTLKALFETASGRVECNFDGFTGQLG